MGLFSEFWKTVTTYFPLVEHKAISNAGPRFVRDAKGAKDTKDDTKDGPSLSLRFPHLNHSVHVSMDGGGTQQQLGLGLQLSSPNQVRRHLIHVSSDGLMPAAVGGGARTKVPLTIVEDVMSRLYNTAQGGLANPVSGAGEASHSLRSIYRKFTAGIWETRRMMAVGPDIHLHAYVVVFDKQPWMTGLKAATQTDRSTKKRKPHMERWMQELSVAIDAARRAWPSSDTESEQPSITDLVTVDAMNGIVVHHGPAEASEGAETRNLGHIPAGLLVLKRRWRPVLYRYLEKQLCRDESFFALEGGWGATRLILDYCTYDDVARATTEAPTVLDYDQHRPAGRRVRLRKQAPLVVKAGEADVAVLVWARRYLTQGHVALRAMDSDLCLLALLYTLRHQYVPSTCPDAPEAMPRFLLYLMVPSKASAHHFISPTAMATSLMDDYGINPLAFVHSILWAGTDFVDRTYFLPRVNSKHILGTLLHPYSPVAQIPPWTNFESLVQAVVCVHFSLPLVNCSQGESVRAASARLAQAHASREAQRAKKAAKLMQKASAAPPGPFASSATATGQVALPAAVVASPSWTETCTQLANQVRSNLMYWYFWEEPARRMRRCGREGAWRPLQARWAELDAEVANAHVEFPDTFNNLLGGARLASLRRTSTGRRPTIRSQRPRKTPSVAQRPRPAGLALLGSPESKTPRLQPLTTSPPEDRLPNAWSAMPSISTDGQKSPSLCPTRTPPTQPPPWDPLLPDTPAKTSAGPGQPKRQTRIPPPPASTRLLVPSTVIAESLLTPVPREPGVAVAEGAEQDAKRRRLANDWFDQFLAPVREATSEDAQAERQRVW